MTIATKIMTRLTGRLVGKDEYGNRYYENKIGKKRRWVMYKGLAEPSKVPPEWHGWLHYTTDKILSKEHSWQKPYTPNATGTANAHFPAGHKKKGGVRDKATGDYEAWEPK